MQPLDKILRNRLECTIKKARDTAEDAARASLQQLGVESANPSDYLSEEERILRRRLRVHGRQLGDVRNAKTQKQEMDRLVEEVAYEHWHRMLFARFLAENNLLMYPDPDDPVAVTLEECEDLAGDEGAKNGWELAARYAARMLPHIFRPDSPSFELILPPEHQQRLERLVADLEPEVFSASDSLGWVYQFWQAKRKDEVNSSEVKIGARELPAVTQLFTEPYMVSFLLDNSLGAWWAGKRLTENDLKTAETEEELRQKASLDGVPLEYLRFVQDEGGAWAPAAGIFDAWPKALAELKTIDPCCGSGHFLVAALLMLVPMRMDLEDLSAKEAVDGVLHDNLHGLELDQRCVELAAFALALTAWSYPDAGGYRVLPELNLACSGLSVSVARDEWKTIARTLPDKSYLPIALDWMYEAFKDAPTLGSLLDPARTRVAGLVKWKEIGPAIKEVLARDQTDIVLEAGVVAHGLAKTTHLLTEKYHWVITNVPYLTRGKQSEILRKFCEKNYLEGKNDLATVFLDRCMELCVKNGTASIVLPENWLFLSTYKKFREKLLKNNSWHLIARLGPGAFETISGEVVKAILITLSLGNANSDHGGLFCNNKLAGILRGLDVSKLGIVSEKATGLLVTEIKSIEQAKQLENPDVRIIMEDRSDVSWLSQYANYNNGIVTGDYPRFGRKYWEIKDIDPNWAFQQSTVDETCLFGGKEHIVYWEQGSGELLCFLTERLGPNGTAAWIRGTDVWKKHGICVRGMTSLPVSLYNGEIFDNNITVITPKSQEEFMAIWAYCSSEQYAQDVRSVNSKLSVTDGSFLQVTFDLEYWTKVAKEKYPNGLPNPYSDDPTQWIFHGHPCGSVVWDEEKKWTAFGPLRTDETVLQVAVARLLGYRWPAELDGEMELSKEPRTWVEKCDGLLKHCDEDGIVCIPAVRGEMKAEDRLENLLAAAYGEDWSGSIKSEILANVDHAGKSMETWLRDKFFAQHCKIFKHRPFVWQVWDGLNDGFAALVNYHKLDAKLLETLIYTYLGDWISLQKHDRENSVDGAEEKLAAAENLKRKLETILEGEAPHDIFVRWKPLEKQPIGWNPDLNDGVRLNIRPFMTAGDVGKKGAGVLRDRPNIKWGKDRGKDVESAPWYRLGLEYGGKEGDRINDHHLTLEEKKEAREEAK